MRTQPDLRCPPSTCLRIKNSFPMEVASPLVSITNVVLVDGGVCSEGLIRISKKRRRHRLVKALGVPCELKAIYELL